MPYRWPGAEPLYELMIALITDMYICHPASVIYSTKVSIIPRHIWKAPIHSVKIYYENTTI